MTTKTPTISEQTTAFLAQVATQAPPEIVQAFTDERASLDAHGLPAGIPAPGTKLPDAHLLDVDGNPTTLEAARDNRPAVLIFYRGAWCPFCNIAFKTYQAELAPALAKLGVALIAVSPQKPDGSMDMQQKHSLTFTLLSDPANALASKLGIVSPPRAENARAATIAFGVDIPGANLDNTDNTPMPTAVVVKADGTIVWIDVHPNYATRSEVTDILDAVRRNGVGA